LTPGGAFRIHPQRMKNALLAALLLALAAPAFTTGCVRTEDGRRRAAVPFSGRDRIEGRYERSASEAMNAAREVLARNGTLTNDDAVTRTLAGRIDTRTVWVRVEELDPRLALVIVQARSKGGTADVTLASQIQTQIALRLQDK
jgi:hypothetical protein